ncbi:hypothetical protein PIB30_097475 [Stylosanthes scabra]|uniref:Uncharacterized protein n=1 Tax=Stylosanthes scabra TaxID=79078 RepID=A0ABU6UV62_9FABA|nr:hypothetical protein [Stylosanthes scabra]
MLLSAVASRFSSFGREREGNGREGKHNHRLHSGSGDDTTDLETTPRILAAGQRPARHGVGGSFKATSRRRGDGGRNDFNLQCWRMRQLFSTKGAARKAEQGWGCGREIGDVGVRVYRLEENEEGRDLSWLSVSVTGRITGGF